MNRLAIWLDNPILVKHSRSRLRKMHLWPSVGVVTILALSIVLLGYEYNGLNGGQTFGGLMMLQIVILGFMGASQVASSVNKAKESGILDFHRVSPMPPFSLALGFFFGAPIREYAMFAATLPFSLVCVFMGRPTPLGFFQLMVPLVLAAWLLHAISLLNALAGKGGKTGSRGIVGLVVFLFVRQLVDVARIHQRRRRHLRVAPGPILPRSDPWLLILAIYLFPPIGFLLVASTRKMAWEKGPCRCRSPRPSAAWRPERSCSSAGSGPPRSEFHWTLLVLYSLIVGSIVLIVTITPSRDEFAKGIRKAAKEGRKYPAAWSDRGLNRIRLVLPLRGGPGGLDGRLADDRTDALLGLAGRGCLVLAAQYPSGSWWWRISGWRCSSFSSGSASEGRSSSPCPCSPPGFCRWSLGRSPPPRPPSEGRRTRPPTSGRRRSRASARSSAFPPRRASSASTASPRPGPPRSSRIDFALLFNNLVTSTRRRIKKEIHPEPASDFQEKTKVEADEFIEPIMLS